MNKKGFWSKLPKKKRKEIVLGALEKSSEDMRKIELEYKKNYE